MELVATLEALEVLVAEEVTVGCEARVSCNRWVSSQSRDMTEETSKSLCKARARSRSACPVATRTCSWRLEGSVQALHARNRNKQNRQASSRNECHPYSLCEPTRPMCSSPTGILVVAVEAEWREGTAAAVEAAGVATAAGLVAAGPWVATVADAPHRSSRCNRTQRRGSDRNQTRRARRGKSGDCRSGRCRPDCSSS